MQLLKSYLHFKYIESNAKLVNFAGWNMPISFSGLINEHNAVRNSGGFFDISHMGIVSIKGINIKDQIQKFFPSNIYSFSKGQSCYSVMLNNSGGIIDDLIIYDLGVQDDNLHEIFLIVNASRYEIDLNWIKSNLNDDNIKFSNPKEGNCLLALQGQNVYKLFEEWSGESINHLQNFGCEYKILKNFINENRVFFSKTGYTGEDGLEVLLPNNLAIDLWEYLITKDIIPCGLGSRDTLRLEAGLHLYGQDLNESINPYEAGLGWLVHLENNHEFFGRNSLEQISNKKPLKKFIGLEIKGKAIARKGCKIFANDKEIGYITSGSWSPTLEKPIALAYIDSRYTQIGQEVDIKIREKVFKGIISKKAFYKKIN
tara:strand:+ start:159 stop:1271 length:1113 start_codon:yes stop_codon:yes gene_type:complete